MTVSRVSLQIQRRHAPRDCITRVLYMHTQKKAHTHRRLTSRILITLKQFQNTKPATTKPDERHETRGTTHTQKNTNTHAVNYLLRVEYTLVLERIMLFMRCMTPREPRTLDAACRTVCVWFRWCLVLPNTSFRTHPVRLVSLEPSSINHVCSFTLLCYLCVCGMTNSAFVGSWGVYVLYTDALCHSCLEYTA